MIVPFEPQSIEQLRERFAASITKLFIPPVSAILPANRAGNRREHLFDFENGIRLMVCKVLTDSIEHIWVSGGINPGYPGMLAKSRAYVMETMVHQFCQISGFTPDDLKFTGCSHGDKNIPNWLVPVLTVNSNLN